MSGFKQWLRSGRHRPFPAAILVIAAHPDDEVIGLGSQLPHCRRLRIVQVTDGAPRNLFDAHNAGFATREAYAAARWEESDAALALAGQPEGCCSGLRIADQEASLDLPGLTHRLLNVLRDVQPSVVLTHPYEGGHPDHDATAFAVQAARLLLESDGWQPQEWLEMTSYHAEDGAMAIGRFLPNGPADEVEWRLSDAEQQFKTRLLACFRTQQQTLTPFYDCAGERFRDGPRYDFTQAPHEGTLWYERFDWGMTGTRWRLLAAEALERLGLAETVCR